MKEKIFTVLNEVGVPCSLKGRRYIEVSLEILLEKGFVSLTKELYPQVAERCNTTSLRVERAVRHAVHICFMNVSYSTYFSIFGNTLNFEQGKCTNGEFLYGLYKYLEINKEK